MSTTKHPVKAPVKVAEKPAETQPQDTKVVAEEDVKETKHAGKKTGKGRAFTYVGAGDGSPYVINLMGKQKFVRGAATEVTDPEILAKIEGMSTFVEGQADAETLHKIDQEGKEAMEHQRAKDVLSNAKFVKKHAGE